MQGLDYLAAAQTGGAGSTVQTIIMIGLIAVVFYFLIWRPQQKRRQQEQQMQGALGPGSEVLTKAGIYGTIVGIQDDIVELEISPGTRIRMLKAGIADVAKPVDAAAEATPDAAQSDTPVEDRPDFPTKRGDDDPGTNDPRP